MSVKYAHGDLHSSGSCSKVLMLQWYCCLLNSDGANFKGQETTQELRFVKSQLLNIIVTMFALDFCLPTIYMTDLSSP